MVVLDVEDGLLPSARPRGGVVWRGEKDHWRDEEGADVWCQLLLVVAFGTGFILCLELRRSFSLPLLKGCGFLVTLVHWYALVRRFSRRKVVLAQLCETNACMQISDFRFQMDGCLACMIIYQTSDEIKLRRWDPKRKRAASSRGSIKLAGGLRSPGERLSGQVTRTYTKRLSLLMCSHPTDRTVSLMRNNLGLT